MTEIVKPCYRCGAMTVLFYYEHEKPICCQCANDLVDLMRLDRLVNG